MEAYIPWSDQITILQTPSVAQRANNWASRALLEERQAIWPGPQTTQTYNYHLFKSRRPPAEKRRERISLTSCQIKSNILLDCFGEKNCLLNQLSVSLLFSSNERQSVHFGLASFGCVIAADMFQWRRKLGGTRIKIKEADKSVYSMY